MVDQDIKSPIRGGLEDIVAFFSIGGPHHILATMCVGGMGICASIGYGAYDGTINDNVQMTGAFGSLYGSAIILLEYHAYKLFREYQKLRNELERNGWDEAKIRDRMGDWFQQRVAEWATWKAGFKDDLSELFERRRHRYTSLTNFFDYDLP